MCLALDMSVDVDVHIGHLSRDVESRPLGIQSEIQDADVGCILLLEILPSFHPGGCCCR